MKLERLRDDLEHAKRKAAEWQARVKDFERQITERENAEILQAVRSITSSPEELRALLAQIQAAKSPHAANEIPSEIEQERTVATE